MSEADFDAIVVGSGCAGPIAALELARAGKSVLVVERGDFAGSKNMTGGRIYTHSLRKVFDDETLSTAPFERKVVRERICLMAPDAEFTADFSSEPMNDPDNESYTVLRAPFDQWLAEQAEEAGAEYICGIPADAVLKDGDRVCGIRAGEDEITSGITELGLAMASRQLRMMGSVLEFESELGVGSTFYFKLKQKVIDEKPIGDFRKSREVMAFEEENVSHQSYTAPDAKILVVDDERMNLAVIKSLLQSTEIQVDTTQSASEALEMMAEKTYDVLLFDHMMREIDGIELMRLVRENRENPNCVVPCIVFTSNVAEGAKEGYLRVGFDAYLPKPINKDRLEGVLLRYLPRSKVKIIPDYPGGTV